MFKNRKLEAQAIKGLGLAHHAFYLNGIDDAIETLKYCKRVARELPAASAQGKRDIGAAISFIDKVVLPLMRQKRAKAVRKEKGPDVPAEAHDLLGLNREPSSDELQRFGPGARETQVLNEEPS